MKKIYKVPLSEVISVSALSVMCTSPIDTPVNPEEQKPSYSFGDANPYYESL